MPDGGRGRGGTGGLGMGGTEIWFHTPGPAEAALPYHVVAAGRTLAVPGAAEVARRYDQHVLILTRAGAGRVRVGGRVWRAAAGTLTWLDTARPYAHGCAAGAALWRYDWIGVRGFGLDRLHAAAGAGGEPVAPAADPDTLARLMAEAAARMRDRSPLQAVENSAAAAALLARVLADRRAAAAGPTGAAPRPAERARLALREGLARRWRVAEIARLAGLSPSQLHRVFRAETGLSPLAWLRTERINAAKPLLLDAGRPVAAVAEAVGYPDPFHFSRDFRALTGRSPRAFRDAGGA